MHPRFVVFECFPKGALAGMSSVNQGRVSSVLSSMPSNQLSGSIRAVIGMPLDRSKDGKTEINMNDVNFMATAAKSFQQSHPPVVNDKSQGQFSDKNKAPKIAQHDSSTQNGKTSNVFAGKIFGFSSSFPEDRVSLKFVLFGTIFRCSVSKNVLLTDSGFFLPER